MHDSTVELQSLASEEGVSAAGHLALVSVVHVCVEVDVVVCLRGKLLVAVCSEGGREGEEGENRGEVRERRGE